MHENNTFSERHNLLINKEAQEVKRGRVKKILYPVTVFTDGDFVLCNIRQVWTAKMISVTSKMVCFLIQNT